MHAHKSSDIFLHRFPARDGAADVQGGILSAVPLFHCLYKVMCVCVSQKETKTG